VSVNLLLQQYRIVSAIGAINAISSSDQWMKRSMPAVAGVGYFDQQRRPDG